MVAILVLHINLKRWRFCKRMEGGSVEGVRSNLDCAAMIIVWAIAIYRRSLPRLIAMQRKVLTETMVKADCAPQAPLNPGYAG